MADSSWSEAPPVVNQPDGAAQAEGNPGRPRNAWIIFRSGQSADRKARGIHKTQAEFSKEFSIIWNGMSEEEKLPYVIAAAIEKAEHQRLYPNYRFNPVKKEEKQRRNAEIKAEKARLKEEVNVQKAIEKERGKKKKSRPAPYTVPPKGRFTAAPDADTESYLPTPPLDIRRSLIPASSSRHVSAEAGPSQPHPLAAPGWLQDGDIDYTDFSNINWSQLMGMQPRQSGAQMSAGSLPLSFVRFDIPESAKSSSENRYDGDHYRSMLAMTREHTGLQVGGIDQDLCIPPPADLDMEVGQHGGHASGVDSSRFDSLFSDVHFSVMPEADFRELANSAFSQPADSPASNSNSPSFFPMHGQGQASTSDYGTDMMQYLNTEAESSTRFVSFDEHARTQSLTAPLSMSNALNVDFNGSTHASGYAQETAFVPYAPPAGASNAGTRRVAGSWKKAVIPDSPVQSRSSSWAVPS